MLYLYDICTGKKKQISSYIIRLIRISYFKTLLIMFKIKEQLEKKMKCFSKPDTLSASFGESNK